MQNSKGIRINKYLSEIGFCSRRQADQYIEQRRVVVNGKLVSLGEKVSNKDKIYIDGKIISLKKIKKIYIAFNKPKGIVCTTDTKREKNNIIDYINFPSRIFPIGRLDKLSEGLILLTNDGDIVNKILRARNNHEKEYDVLVNKPINNDFIEKMSKGIPVLNTITRKCFVKQTGTKSFKIILTQGLNRQIRRMCEYLDYEVRKLKRIRIMNIKIDIESGYYRNLSSSELNELNNLLSNSKKTID
tara:strand:- start:3682 stop:4413 length:732 start_codon:yes stop_codon:yes gene_type:complete